MAASSGWSGHCGEACASFQGVRPVVPNSRQAALVHQTMYMVYEDIHIP